MTPGLVLAAVGGSAALLRLVLTIGSAVLCYQLAARKGRNRLAWAAAGFITVLAVVLIAVLPHARNRDPWLPA
jgi:4-amino-4-deoxy-L-arabinose transferase-like glycosyltransferase